MFRNWLVVHRVYLSPALCCLMPFKTEAVNDDSLHTHYVRKEFIPFPPSWAQNKTDLVKILFCCVFLKYVPKVLGLRESSMAKLRLSLQRKYCLLMNDFITKLLSKLLRDLSNRVHLESISKFINKVINRYCFCKWTLKNRSIYKNTVY